MTQIGIGKTAYILRIRAGCPQVRRVQVIEAGERLATVRDCESGEVTKLSQLCLYAKETDAMVAQTKLTKV